jgi:hypothetical protein
MNRRERRAREAIQRRVARPIINDELWKQAKGGSPATAQLPRTVEAERIVSQTMTLFENFRGLGYGNRECLAAGALGAQCLSLSGVVAVVTYVHKYDLERMESGHAAPDSYLASKHIRVPEQHPERYYGHMFIRVGKHYRSSSKRVPPEFGRLISLGAKKSCAAIS